MNSRLQRSVCRVNAVGARYLVVAATRSPFMPSLGSRKDLDIWIDRTSENAQGGLERACGVWRTGDRGVPHRPGFP